MKEKGVAYLKPEFWHHQHPPCQSGLWFLVTFANPPLKPPREQICLTQPQMWPLLPFPPFPLRISQNSAKKAPQLGKGGLFGAPVGDSALQEFLPRPGFNKSLLQVCCSGLVRLSAALGSDEALLNSARGREAESWSFLALM